MRFGYHADQFQNQYSKEQEQEFNQVFGSITNGFAELLAAGIGPDDERVQALVKRHHEFILQFWTPNKDSYKSLAMSYILPSPYRDTYEAVATGLGQYHYDAICIWANANL